MNPDYVSKRMEELIKPVDRQIMMCDNREDLLMLACCMLTAVKDIFDQQLGVDGRKKMFKDLV